MDIKYYDLSGSQRSVAMQQQYCLHPGMMHLSMALLFNKEFDLKRLREAVNIEIERNDALRLRFTHKKTDGKKKQVQWFTESYDIGEIPYYDFTGFTEEKQYEQLKKISLKPFKYYDDVSFKILVFKSFDGKTGVLPLMNHLCGDAYGLFNTINNIMKVYVALEHGTELPPALSSFEEILKHETVYTKEEEENDVRYFHEIMKQGEDKPDFSHPSNLKIPMSDKLRKQITKEASGMGELVGLLRDGAGYIKIPVDKETSQAIFDFCEANQIGLSNFVYFALAIYLSYVNNKQKYVFTPSFCHRRSKLKEKRAAGCMATSAWLRVKIDEADSFDTCMKGIQDQIYEAYKHLRVRAQIPSDIFRLSYGTSTFAKGGFVQYTTIEINPDIPEGYEYDLLWISRGHTQTGLYFFNLVSSTGGMEFNYEYRLDSMNEAMVEYMHKAILAILSEVSKDRSVKIGHLFDLLDGMIPQ